VKTLYLLGGPMGVGKTAVGQALKQSLDRSVFLDGDWCWDAHPFQVTEETKAMVLDNIAHLLNNFLRCTAYDHVIFAWVMDEAAIWDSVLSRLTATDCRVRRVALLCSPDALTQRLSRDVASGLRQADVIPRSLARLPKYAAIPAVKLDTSRLTINEAARLIAGDGLYES